MTHPNAPEKAIADRYRIGVYIRMMKSILSTILILGLLGSGEVCAWICRDGSVPVATVAKAQPDACHGKSDSTAPASQQPPVHDDDCSVCELDLALTAAPEWRADPSKAEEPTAVPWAAIAGTTPPEWLARKRPRLPSTRHLPSRDVLTLTTTLQV